MFPNRNCVTHSSKNNSATSKRSWGSRNESTSLLPLYLRKREQSGALARRSRKGTQASAKIVPESFSPKVVDGSLVRRRTDVPGGPCLEKPPGEVMPSSKPPTSLGEQLKPCDNNLIQTSRGLRKKTSAELCWRKMERAPRFDAQTILLNILSGNSPPSFARKSPDLPEDTCGRNDSLSHSEILPSSARCDKSSLLMTKVCESSTSSSSSSPSDS